MTSDNKDYFLKTPSDVTVVGLGYVGLPLALAFAAKLHTTGFDNDASRIEELRCGKDRNLEVDYDSIKSSKLKLTYDDSCVAEASFIVVSVPTPITAEYQPELKFLESASAMIGRGLRYRSPERQVPIIVFESTTYPGCTEDFCGPIIERESRLKSGEGFLLGYSPERTNFGDTEHTLETVIKVVAGQTETAARVVKDVYSKIAKSGVHMVPNIKTAEASKVIENVQRDLNIALFNETAMIFDRMGINSSDVFGAAGTKWNFHKYQPGLVGGHCIPVDPYYLTYAAQKIGYEANVILAGRGVNERMVEDVVNKIMELIASVDRDEDSSSVLVLGQTFKSDVADFRNSKARHLAETLSSRFASVRVYDPYGAKSDINRNPICGASKYDVVVLAVGHSEFLSSIDDIADLVEPDGVFVDLTGNTSSTQFDDLGFRYWGL